jgi:hypothetical protein
MVGSKEWYAGMARQGWDIGDQASALNTRGSRNVSDAEVPQEMRRLLARLEFISRQLTEETLRIDAIGNRAFGPEPENAGGEAEIHAEPYGFVAQFDLFMNGIDSTIHRLGVASKRLDRL